MVKPTDRIELARKNGKPSDANRIAGRTAAMDARDYGGRATANDGSQIERVGDTVYRYVPKYDHTIIERNGETYAPLKGNRLPGGSIDGMIDQVLEMSGMAGPKNVPVPTPRPESDSGMTGMDNHPGKMTDDYVGEPAAPVDASAQEPEGGWSMTDYLLGALGIGGAAAAVKAMMKKYGQQNGNNVGADAGGTTSAVDPADDITAVADTDEQKAKQITDQRTSRLPPPMEKIEGPRKQLVGPSAIDDSIAATMPDDQSFDQGRFGANPDPKLLTDADAPYTPRNPEKPIAGQITDADSPYTTRPGNYAPSNAPQVPDDVVKAAAEKLQSGDLRGAYGMLRDAGIDIDPKMMEMFANQANLRRTLSQRAGEMASGAARRAAQ